MKAGAAPRTGLGRTRSAGNVVRAVRPYPSNVPPRMRNKPFLTDEEVAAARTSRRKPILGAMRGRPTANQDVSGAYNAVFSGNSRSENRQTHVNGHLIRRMEKFRLWSVGDSRRAEARGRGGAGAFGGGRGGNDNPETVRAVSALPRRADAVPAIEHGLRAGHGDADCSVPEIHGHLHGGRSRGWRQPRHFHGRTSTRPLLPRGFILGDSRGHWEGNTLVIETTNFEQGFRGSNPDTRTK